MNFNINKHFLEIRGNVTQKKNFINKVFKLLENYLQNLEEQTFIVNIEITYFNEYGSLILLNLFDKLDKAIDDSKNIIVNWIFDSEIYEEYGKEIKEDFTMPFNLVPKSISE
ncbi:MAG: SiaC family regulatory phosphoprotein [Candidatus Marithrix sp.]